jgi:hypothetical protein
MDSSHDDYFARFTCSMAASTTRAFEFTVIPSPMVALPFGGDRSLACCLYRMV